MCTCLVYSQCHQNRINVEPIKYILYHAENYWHCLLRKQQETDLFFNFLSFLDRLLKNKKHQSLLFESKIDICIFTFCKISSHIYFSFALRFFSISALYSITIIYIFYLLEIGKSGIDFERYHVFHWYKKNFLFSTLKYYLWKIKTVYRKVWMYAY